MEKWINKLSQVVAFFGKSVSWLSFVLVIIICLDVISRYLLNFSVAWVAEIEWHIFGLLFLFGSAYALNEEHLPWQAQDILINPSKNNNKKAMGMAIFMK